MNIRLNPILKKDLRVTSRTMKFSWGIFIFEAFLGIIFLFAMLLPYPISKGIVRRVPVLKLLLFGEKNPDRRTMD